MPTLADDQAYFQGGVRELEEYLLASELFWPLSSGKGLPRLTIGGLLLSQIRLRARAIPEEGRGDLSRAEGDLKALRRRWPAAWERKATQEVDARLSRWQDFLMEDQQAQDYPRRVQGRVILQILKNEVPDISSAWITLETLDQQIKQAWLPGLFIWEKELSSSFPANEFWFLYGKVKSRE